MKILVIDVGGTHVKLLATGQGIKRQMNSGPRLTPRQMVAGVKKLTADWTYDVISIGVPSPVLDGRIVAEPSNLGRGWMAFDFAEAFARPVKLINDAAMQALGSYRRGRMLFLGVGTGLGSAVVQHGTAVGLELAHLPYHKGRTYEDYLGLRGLKRLGKKRWRKHVLNVVELLRKAMVCDDSGPRGRQCQAARGAADRRSPGRELPCVQGRVRALAGDKGAEGCGEP